MPSPRENRHSRLWANASVLLSALTRAVLEPVGEYRAMSRAGLALVADRRAQLGLAAR